MTKRTPDLGRSEIAMRVRVEIPDECFAAPIINGGHLSATAESLVQPTGTVKPYRLLHLNPDHEGGADGAEEA